MSKLSESLPLPCGAVLKNRLAKDAMSEQLGDRELAPRPELATLYRRWANGGTGLLITGNVMVDPQALGEPGNVVLSTDIFRDRFAAWAEAGQTNGAHVWMQINHPGRQSPRTLSPHPVAPSAVPLEIPGVFGEPRAATEPEIQGIISAFANTARLAKEAGFTGVQIHGAHGYLVSQFLSQHTNRRTDGWGGSPENRRRFLIEIVRAIRASVGASFPISVKLNSADFQKGGFTEEESLEVVRALDAEKIDLLEISGGTYERPAMQGTQKASTAAREAYFLDYARRARAVTRIPLMVTGGFRTKTAMEQALAEQACDVIGLARPLALEPNLSARLLDGRSAQSENIVRRGGKGLAGAYTEIFWHTLQLHRMGQGKNPDAKLSAWEALTRALLFQGSRSFGIRRG